MTVFRSLNELCNTIHFPFAVVTPKSLEPHSSAKGLGESRIKGLEGVCNVVEDADISGLGA